MGEVVEVDRVGAARAADLAAAALGAGGVVIFPTDTVYGLAAAVFRPGGSEERGGEEGVSPWREPIEKLYEIKRRPLARPAIVLAGDWDLAQRLTPQSLEIPKNICERLALPLTFIVKSKKNWGPPTTNANGAIAVRVPRESFASLILKSLDYLYSVSANYPGRSAPPTLGQVPAPLREKVALAVDGGPSPAISASFIVDYTTEIPKPVRGGEELKRALQGYRS